MTEFMLGFGSYSVIHCPGQLRKRAREIDRTCTGEKSDPDTAGTTILWSINSV